MKVFTRITIFVILALAGGAFVQSVKAQSIMDPNDPIVEYIAGTPIPAQPAWGQIGKWVRTKRLNWNTDSYKAYIYKGNQFRLKFPKTYNPTANDGKTYPIIIMFHGLGEPGPITDNEYQMYHGGEVHRNAVDNGQFDGYVLFMQTQGGYWGDAHYAAISEILDYMAVNNKLDPFRINIHGLSAGGQAAWRMAINYPTKIASMLPMSASSVAYKEGSIVNALKYTPIWLFQGSDDGAPAPSTSKQVRDAILAVGGNFTYTEYEGVGHGTWYLAYAEPNFFPYINKAHKANPWALGGRTEFCPGDPINITIGVTAGFNEYQWRKDSILIQGATSNQINVTTVGVYECRVRKGSLWSPWSPTPLVVKIKEATISPDIQVSGIASKVLPSLDGNTGVKLEVPPGYTSYLWQKIGSGSTISTTRFLENATPGNYRIKVTELYGCSSDFSNSFTVIDANGPNKPDAPINLTVTTLSKTSLRLDWSDNPSPANNETNFEIYQASDEGGPYKLIGFADQDVLTYTIDNLTSNTKLFYKVRAINNTAASASSNEANGTTATDSQAPSAPANLTISGSSRNSITLSWAASADDVGVTQYDIYINGAKSFVTPDLSFTVYGLEEGRTYNFTVKARDFAQNYSPFSNQVTGQPLLRGLNYKYYTFTGTWNALPDFNTLTPAATGLMPNVALTPRTQDDNFAFLWEGYINIPDSGSYTFRTNSDDGSRLWLDPYSFSTPSLVNNDGLHGGQNVDGSITLDAGTYPISIAFYEQGGGETMIVSWKTPKTGNNFVQIPDDAFKDAPVASPGSAPASPGNFSAVAQSYDKIELSWTDNSDNESGFEIWRASGSNGFTTIATIGSNSTSFIDNDLQPETQYFYRIKAINQYGESNFSEGGSSGMNYSYYELTGISSLPNFNTLTPKKTGTVSAVGLGMQDRGDNFQLKLSGFINIPVSGTYTFYTSSDDGSKLYIDGFDESHVVVNNDGAHGTQEKSGTVVLSSGFHQIDVTFFESGGGEVLTASISGPGLAKQQIPASMLFLDPGVNATTMALPPVPFKPVDLAANGMSTSSIAVNWNYNPTVTSTINNPPSTTRVEAESFIAMNGIQTENSSEGTQNVGWIEAGDWMDYSVNIPVAGTVTFNFRVASPGSNTGQISIKNQGGTVLGTASIPATGGYQAYTTVSTTASLPAGVQTIRIYANKNGWNFNWFELITEGSTTTVTDTAYASSFELYRSNNNNSNYILLASLPGSASSYIDSSLFANSVFYYKIRAVNEGGISDFSGEDSAKTANNIPAIVAIDSQNMRYGTELQLAIQATDVDPENLTFGFENLPSFANFVPSDNGTGTLVINPTLESDQGLYANIVVKVFDQHGDSSSTSFNLLVNDNYLPAIGGVGNVTLNEMQEGQITLTATDQNSGDILEWSLEGVPSFATVTTTPTSRTLNLAPGYADNGVYSVSVRVEDGNGGFDTSSFVITVNDVNPNKKVYINFNYGNNAPAPWNNTNKNPKINDDLPNLLDETGANSGMGVKIISAWINNGYNTLGVNTGNNSGVYPDAVLTSAYFGQNNTQSIRIYGLNPVYKYNFTFLGSRGSVTDDRTTIYTINGQSVSLNAASNRYNTVSLLNMQPEADGTLVMSMKNGGASQYSYLNAMVVESIYDDGTVPARPRNLATQFANNQAALSWVDAAYNEDAYQIYRSTLLEGPYTLLNPDGNNANSQSYNDGSIAGETTYYYYVTASNAAGVSLSSDTVSFTPPNTAPSIASISDVNMKVQQTVTIDVTATDPGDVITLDVTGLPAFATFASTGNGTGTITVTPGDIRGTFEGVTVIATDNKGASSEETFRIVVKEAGVIPVYVNFNQVSPVGSPWNSFNATPAAGTTISALKDNTGFATSISVTLVNAFDPNNLGATTGNNSGVYPDDVMLTSYYHNGNTGRTIRISGLDPAEKYNLVLFGSRSGSANDNRNTVFAAGGQSVTLNAAGNTQNVVKLTELTPNASGIIDFTVARASGASYAYINALVIEGFQEDGGPVTPAESPVLRAVGKTRTSIQLNWQNTTLSQTGVEVYRSSTEDGSYSLLATLAGNSTSYLDASLPASTQYFYKVRAALSTGYTSYSNVATAATISYGIYVNFNRQSAEAPAPWNNTNSLPQDGNVYPNLKSDLNNPTGINLNVIEGLWSGENIYGSVTGDDSGVYPDVVIGSTWWLDKGNTGRLKLDGLNQSMRYSVIFFASRDGAGSSPDRTTTYTINGKSVSLNAVNNTNQTVQINDIIPNEEGAAIIEINAGGSSPYGYLGALVIQGYSLPIELQDGNVATTTTSGVSELATSGTTLLDASTTVNLLTTDNGRISVYPNPFVDNVTLKLSLNRPAAKLTVYVADITGRIVFTKEIQNVSQGTIIHKLELGGLRLSPGIYFIKLTGIEGDRTEPVKIMKTK